MWKKRILTSHDYVDESSDLAWSQILIIEIRSKYVIAVTITVVVIISVGVSDGSSKNIDCILFIFSSILIHPFWISAFDLTATIRDYEKSHT